MKEKKRAPLAAETLRGLTIEAYSPEPMEPKALKTTKGGGPMTPAPILRRRRLARCLRCGAVAGYEPGEQLRCDPCEVEIAGAFRS